MIEWIKKLGDELMPEPSDDEPQTAKERARSPEHIARVNELGRAKWRLAQQGNHSPSVAEIFDERDRGSE